MSSGEMERLNERISVADLPPGTVLEVITISSTQTQFGKMALFKAITSSTDRKIKVISAPERFCQDNDNEVDLHGARSSIYVYFGKQTMKRSKSSNSTSQFHNLKQYEERFDTVDAMHRRAAEMKKMLLEQLNSLLLTIHSFTDMPAGSVLVTEGVRFVECVNSDGKFRRSVGGAKTGTGVCRVPVCKYSLGDTRGEIFIPTRFSDQIKSLNGIAVVVYRGKKMSKEGREYSDIIIMDETDANTLTSD